MTRDETVNIIRVMVDSYPNYKPNNLSETVDVWHMMLSDYDYKLVSMALKSYILSDTSGFAPAIGQLVAKMHAITQPQELNEMEAWSLVSKAIRNSAYNAADEYARLPPVVQKAVGLPNQLMQWAIDDNYNESVVSSNFMRCYRIELAREKELSMLPEDARKIAQNGSGGSYAAQIGEERERVIKLSLDRKQGDIKALETKNDSVPMPDKYKDIYEKLK